MSNVLRISVRFIDPMPAFHGKRDGDQPEWPPSPLRVFQALVDAAANRWREALFISHAKPALEWLQDLRPSEIVVPSHHVGKPFRLSVPNNDLDSPASVWARGGEPIKPHRPVDLRTMKTVQTTHVRIGTGSRADALYFLFPLPAEGCPFLEIVRTAARSVTHLGWGIDMVAADADVISEADAAGLPGHRWRVVPGGGVPLRVPKVGTLDDLLRKHAAFLGRLSREGFRPVPPLRCFDVVRYHSPTVAGSATAPPPLAAFEIHRTIEDQEKPENAGKSRFRPFHHVRRVAEVAGMVRFVTAAAARILGWAEEDVVRRIEGHDVLGGPATSRDRLQFLPLPSITPVGVGGIRRVLVVGPPGSDLAPLRRHLNGAELIDEETKQPVAMLSSIATTDRNVAPYLGRSTTWSTVTPMILPGFDDPDGLRKKLRAGEGSGTFSSAEQRHLLARLDARILALIWKAFDQAGWTDDALAGAHVEYRGVGWIRGLDLASNYRLSKAPFPRYHVRIRFARPTSGPLIIGAGRYRGLGIFVREE